MGLITNLISFLHRSIQRVIQNEGKSDEGLITILIVDDQHKQKDRPSGNFLRIFESVSATVGRLSLRRLHKVTPSNEQSICWLFYLLHVSRRVKGDHELITTITTNHRVIMDDPRQHASTDVWFESELRISEWWHISVWTHSIGDNSSISIHPHNYLPPKYIDWSLTSSCFIPLNDA
jgi:hypothetical protein